MKSGINQTQASSLVHTDIGTNYLQFLNGVQMEQWMLYNGVCVVKSFVYARTMKFLE